jgi:hypothetical protein
MIESIDQECVLTLHKIKKGVDDLHRSLEVAPSIVPEDCQEAVPPDTDDTVLERLEPPHP